MKTLSAIAMCLLLVMAGVSWAAVGAPPVAGQDSRATASVDSTAPATAARNPAAQGPEAANRESATPPQAAGAAKAAAQEAPSGAKADSAWPAGLEVGAEIYHDRYAEPGVMRERGMMYGLTGAYTWRTGPLMLREELRAAFGDVNYFSPVAGSLNGISDETLELRALVGRDFSVWRSTTLTPYAGLGTRYLWDDSSGKLTSMDFVGYDRESSYLYSPIGLSSFTPLCGNWSFGTTVEYDLFWFGRQISYLSDVSAGEPNVANDQHGGFGLRGSVRFIRQFRKSSLVIEPFVRYWHIETSDVSFGGVEPDNRTVEAGVDVSIDF